MLVTLTKDSFHKIDQCDYGNSKLDRLLDTRGTRLHGGRAHEEHDACAVDRTRINSTCIYRLSA